MQVEVKSGVFTPEEIQQCIFLVKKRWGTRLHSGVRLTLERTDDTVQVTFDPPINREVYRSTDYLVNDLGKLNRGKYAEHTEKQMHLSVKGADGVAVGISKKAFP